MLSTGMLDPAIRVLARVMNADPATPADPLAVNSATRISTTWLSSVIGWLVAWPRKTAAVVM